MKRTAGSVVFGLAGLLALGAILTTMGHAGADTDLLVVSPQLVTRGNSNLYQYRYAGGQDYQAWYSGPMEGMAGSTVSVGSGDIDNCGAAEVYAITNVFAFTEKVDRKTTRTYSYRNLYIFKTGATQGALVIPLNLGESASDGADRQPADATPSGARDSIVADADNDGKQDLIVIHGSHIDVYQFQFDTLVKEAHSGSLPSGSPAMSLTSIDVGDTDNDLANEIVTAQLGRGAPYVIEFDGTLFTQQPVTPCAVYKKGFTSFTPDQIKVRDGDNLTDITRDNVPGLRGNEIVAGGNNNRLVVWKHDPATGNYGLQFVSGDLGDLTLGVDAGDIDGSGQNEIVIGNIGSNRTIPFLWVFAYESGKYIVRSKTPLTHGRICGIEIGDLDLDGMAEVVAVDTSIYLYKQDSGVLELTWSGIGGLDAEIR